MLDIYSFTANTAKNTDEKKKEHTRPKKKERLDVLLVERGFFDSRENAKRHIMAGIVLVDNVPVDKAGTKVPVKAEIRLKGKVMPYVGRGGFKLEKAIKTFGIDLHDKVMADFGASTGGFTDCALKHGAKKVFAIDVGYNQLDWRLRNNAKVVNMEKMNIKGVTLDVLKEKVDFIATDISFISVLKIIPAVKSVLKDDGSLVILIKPQFEAGKEKVSKGGIVRDPLVHEDVISKVIHEFAREGFSIKGLTYSPIKGGQGNIEFLAYIQHAVEGEEQVPYTAEQIHDLVTLAHTNLKG